MIARGFLLSILVLAGCGQKPSPTPELRPEFYPLRVGCRWEYRSLLFKGTREVKRTIRKDGKEWFEMTYTFPLNKESLLMRQTSDGVIARRKKHEQLIMRFPMKKGDSWTIDFPGEDLAVCTVENSEELEILGKKIPCSRLRVDLTSRKSGETNRDFEWYAEGLGLVRMAVTRMKITHTFTLYSYTAPKGSP